MIEGINAIEAGTTWSPNPSPGAVLRGVKWTVKAIAAIPPVRPH